VHGRNAGSGTSKNRRDATGDRLQLDDHHSV
jgi:hypothetical protein